MLNIDRALRWKQLHQEHSRDLPLQSNLMLMMVVLQYAHVAATCSL